MGGGEKERENLEREKKMEIERYAAEGSKRGQYQNFF